MMLFTMLIAWLPMNGNAQDLPDSVINVNEEFVAVAIRNDIQYDSYDFGKDVAVDLGLPSGILWASCNLGATKPEEFGSYYAWGETAEKEVYNKKTYTLYDELNDVYFDIGKNISGTKYDAAYMKLGEKWRMPTIEDFLELLENCEYEWITYRGVKGGLVTSKCNGNRIFLPAAGYLSDFDKLKYDFYNSGNYWLDSRLQGKFPYILTFNKRPESLRSYVELGYYGLPVRPVKDQDRIDRITIKTDILLDTITTIISEGHTVTLRARGRSMIPFIFDEEKAFLEKCSNYNIGDIALAHVEGFGQPYYVLHRIISIDSYVTLMGDGNVMGKEKCPLDSLKAICRKKFDGNGKMIKLDDDIQKARVGLWNRCLSERDSLLSHFSSGNNDRKWKELFRSYLLQNDDELFIINPIYKIIVIDNEKIITLENSDVDFTKLISLNDSAELLFNKMSGKTFSVNDMVNILQFNYAIDKNTAYQDCVELLCSWFSVGIIQFKTLLK